jgi:hypothetical protein
MAALRANGVSGVFSVDNSSEGRKAAVNLGLSPDEIGGPASCVRPPFTLRVRPWAL